MASAVCTHALGRKLGKLTRFLLILENTKNSLRVIMFTLWLFTDTCIPKGKVHVKLILCLTKHRSMKPYWAESRHTSHTLGPGTRWRWVVSLTPRPLYPQGKSTCYPLNRRVSGGQSRSGRGGEEKNFQTMPGIEQPPPPNHPACRPALYHWDIPAFLWVICCKITSILQFSQYRMAWNYSHDDCLCLKAWSAFRLKWN
jgi:hypothetical protein